MNSIYILENLTKSTVEYEDYLKRFNQKKYTFNQEDAFNILIIRDNIYELLSNKELYNDKTLVDILTIDKHIESLDNSLKKHQYLITEQISLDKWRSRFHPPKTKWWWYLQSPAKIDKWVRYDWVWNLLTLIIISFTASFTINIINALSIGDLSIIATFSSIAQVGGLAVISQGALTEKGRLKAQVLLNRLSIPPRFHSEVTFIISLVLFTSVFYSHSILADYYYERGYQYYEKGELNNAELEYLRALKINPNRMGLNNRLGQVYESMGKLNKASEQYSIASQNGSIVALVSLGRTMINSIDPELGKANPIKAQVVSLLAFQRLDYIVENNINFQKKKKFSYQIYRNIGWASSEQKKYKVAQEYLLEAIRIDELLTVPHFGSGMAYCFLAHIYTLQKKENQARTLWLNCLEKARPETMFEYGWFISFGYDYYGSCIDSSRVVAGIDKYHSIERVENICKQKLRLKSLSTHGKSAFDKQGVIIVGTEPEL